MTTIAAHPTTLSKGHEESGSCPGERRRAVAVLVTVRWCVDLSEHAYDLWVDGSLHGELDIPDDGRTRIEIIGGVIVLSPGPLADHAGIASDIRDAFTLVRASNKDYPWRCVENLDFNLRHVGDGYIPDLTVLSADDFAAARATHARNVIAEQVRMVVEITSKSTASDDREPDVDDGKPTKWSGYAREGVEFYLLVDRDPKSLGTTLYSNPHLARGFYQSKKQWSFGEAITLPDPFNVEIPTDEWEPWED